jgi:hypothetical protein
MLQLVDHHREEYNTTERASKNAIVERLICLIKSEGGRFLERVDECGNDAYWSEVPHATAYKKVSSEINFLTVVGRNILWSKKRMAILVDRISVPMLGGHNILHASVL